MCIDMPSISKSRDHGELQDMYRRTLAASWAANSSELPAEKCIENSASDEFLHRHHRNLSGASSHSQSTITVTRNRNKMAHKHSASRDSLGPDSATGRDTSSEGSERGRQGFRKAQEVDEFDIRDDLIAWKSGTVA